MNKWLVVLRQEFKMMVQAKAFWVTTLLGPLFILGVTILPGYMANRSMNGGMETQKVGFYNASLEMEGILANVSLSGGLIAPEFGDNLEAMKEEVTAGNLDGVVVFEDDYLNDSVVELYSGKGVDIILSEILEGIIGDAVVSIRMRAAGLDYAEVRELSMRPDVQSFKLGSEDDKVGGSSIDSIIYSVLAMVMLLYMTILIYGQSIGRAVVKERSTKTVEILLSSAKPRDLMWGKILGIGLAGFLQYVIWGGGGFVLIKLIGQYTSFPIQLNFPSEALGWLLTFFILGYFLYASAYAALGAMSEDDQHLGQMGFPLLLFLIVPLIIFSSSIVNPDNTANLVLSFIPLCAPVSMFARIIMSDPPLWQIALSVGGMLVTLVLFVIAGGKIFRIAILMSGKRFKFKEVFNLLRQ